MYWLYLNGGGWVGSVVAVLILICAFWRKVRVFVIPLIVLITYFFIQYCVESYRKEHPPKSKYDDMPIEELFAEVASRDDSIRSLPTYHFLEQSLKKDYGLNLTSGGYSQEKSNSTGKYEVYGLASDGKNTYIFSTDVSSEGGKMSYSRLVFRNNSGNGITLKMADGSEPDARQITISQSLNQIMSD